MKYVRTKDRAIIDVAGKKIVGSYYGMKPDEICINCEYREADTIEELLDAYVSVDVDGPHYMSKTVYRAFKHKISRRNVYGAIWVFDGDNAPTLKPAAKMNEKGEWELL